MIPPCFSLNNQVSTSALPSPELHQDSISSLPPDCLRAATGTEWRRSEVLRVIFLLLTPQHHILFILQYIHTTYGHASFTS